MLHRLQLVSGRPLKTFRIAPGPAPVDLADVAITSGGTVLVLEAASGRILWEYTTNSGIIAPTTTFTVAGKQYLAVQAGWDGDARAMAGNVARFFPGEVPDVPTGGAIWVFALE